MYVTKTGVHAPRAGTSTCPESHYLLGFIFCGTLSKVGIYSSSNLSDGTLPSFYCLDTLRQFPVENSFPHRTWVEPSSKDRHRIWIQGLSPLGYMYIGSRQMNQSAGW